MKGLFDIYNRVKYFILISTFYFLCVILDIYIMYPHFRLKVYSMSNSFPFFEVFFVLSTYIFFIFKLKKLRITINDILVLIFVLSYIVLLFINVKDINFRDMVILILFIIYSPLIFIINEKFLNIFLRVYALFCYMIYIILYLFFFRNPLHIRAVTFIFGPNVFIFVYLVKILIDLKNKVKTSILWLDTFIYVCFLIITISRAGLVVSTILILIGLHYTIRFSKNKLLSYVRKILSPITIMAIVFLFIGMSITFYDLFIAKTNTHILVKKSKKSLIVKSWSDRLVNRDILKDRRFLYFKYTLKDNLHLFIGNGVGSFFKTYNITDAHNLFLNILYDTGSIYFILFLLLLIYVLIFSFNNLNFYFVFVYFIFLLVLLLSGANFYVYTYYFNVFFFVLFFAHIRSVLNNKKEKEFIKE